MGKLFIWVVIILVVMVVMRIVAARNSAARQQAKAPPPARQPGQGPVESMVRCAHCGVHLPRSEATLIGGKTWCSSEHARLGER